MAKVTGLNCIDEAGYRVLCDPFGNNVAFRCPACGGPVLSIILENQRDQRKGTRQFAPLAKSLLDRTEGRSSTPHASRNKGVSTLISEKEKSRGI